MFYHVFKLDSAQEARHKDEIEKQKWPENLDVRPLEATCKVCNQRRLHQIFPQLILLQLPLESFIFVRLSRGQYKVRVYHAKLLFLRVLCRCQVQEDMIEIEKPQQVCNDSIPLLHIHPNQEEAQGDPKCRPPSTRVKLPLIQILLVLALCHEHHVFKIDAGNDQSLTLVLLV